jgi:large subunit ribosomal protein L9
MRIILLKDVQGLGARGAVHEVKGGYARNYLIPRGFAVEASDSNMRALATQRQATERQSARAQQETAALAAALGQAVVEMRAKGGEGGRLFGAITAQDIAEALAAQGFAVTKKQVELSEPIKSGGSHKIPVRVGGGIVAHVDLNVIATA